MRSPGDVIGLRVLKAAAAEVCPVPPFDIATVPVTFVDVPFTLPVSGPENAVAVTVPATSRADVGIFPIPSCPLLSNVAIGTVGAPPVVDERRISQLPLVV